MTTQIWPSMSQFQTEDKEHVYMQYTGLHDKNGKEIYEGDIVKYYQSPNYSKNWRTEVVSFEDGCFAPKPGYTGSDDLSDFTNEGFEVIGNIYENPELLEGK